MNNECINTDEVGATCGEALLTCLYCGSVYCPFCDKSCPRGCLEYDEDEEDR